MISLHKLEIFLVVVTQGSFNKAANNLFMSQSAISQHMKDLEATLGADLFVRSPRGVTLTEAGEVLYQAARKILQMVEDVTDEIAQLGEARQLSIALGTTPGVSVYILPRWMQRFQRSYDNLNVSLDSVRTQAVVEGVLSQQYALGFLEGALNELDRPYLGQIDLWQIEYFVMVGTSHPWRHRETIAATELGKQPFINRQATSRTRQWVERMLGECGVNLRNAAELDSPGTIKYALLSGMGVGILPEYAVVGERERGEIIALRIDDLPLQRPFKLVWDEREPFDALQRTFLTLISEDVPAVRALL